MISDKKIGLEYSPISKINIEIYQEFLTEVFAKKHLNKKYLDWLYFQNPNGVVVGFDAFFNGRLVGHYACIPIIIDSYDYPALLSLNTAVSEDFQGKGLFRDLAMMTFDVSKNDFSCVIGVANKKSFRGFVRHLGFEHLGELNLRFGRIKRFSKGQRVYSEKELMWRSINPSGALSVQFSKAGDSAVLTKFYKRFFQLKSVVNILDSKDSNFQKSFGKMVGFTVDWRSDIDPMIYLPKKFKPAPLHLIFKPLKSSENKLTSWSFPDFDVL